MQKKFQVALGSMMNNAAYVSPLTGTQYNSYFEYLTSTTEFSDPRTEGLGANAILTTDKYAHGPSSPFYDVGVSLSQLTTLEGDVKTEEEMELKQVVETSKPAPQPAAPVSTPIEGLKERLDSYGNATVVLPTNFNEGPRPKGRLNAFKSSIIKVADNLQILADLNLNEFDFLTDEDKQRLDALKPLAKEFTKINIDISLSTTRTTAVEQRYAELTNKLANEFVDIIGKHVKTQFGKEITSSKPTTTAPTITAPAVVKAPAAPKVTSSSQVIEDDLSLLMNPNKPIEETRIFGHYNTSFDPNAAAVSASEKLVLMQHKLKNLVRHLEYQCQTSEL